MSLKQDILEELDYIKEVSMDNLHREIEKTKKLIEIKFLEEENEI